MGTERIIYALPALRAPRRTCADARAGRAVRLDATAADARVRFFLLCAYDVRLQKPAASRRCCTAPAPTLWKLAATTTFLAAAAPGGAAAAHPAARHCLPSAGERTLLRQLWCAASAALRRMHAAETNSAFVVKDDNELRNSHAMHSVNNTCCWPTPPHSSVCSARRAQEEQQVVQIRRRSGGTCGS
jgi:hypothetical protein